MDPEYQNTKSYPIQQSHACVLSKMMMLISRKCTDEMESEDNQSYLSLRLRGFPSHKVTINKVGLLLALSLISGS